MMSIKRRKSSGGFTFVEVMGAILVLTIAVLGASAYRYHATLDTRKADLQTTAARMASLLCETWRATEDPNTFNPVAYFGTELAIEELYIPSPYIQGTHHSFTTYSGSKRLGAYRIVTEGISYDAMLSWRDVSPGLRALNVVVVWGEQVFESNHSSGRPNNIFRLTTYVVN